MENDSLRSRKIVAKIKKKNPLIYLNVALLGAKLQGTLLSQEFKRKNLELK
jgi:hypothetical protein